MPIVRRLRGSPTAWILAAVAFGWFMTLGVRFLLPAVLPQITETYRIDNTTAGIAITAVWLGYGLTQFPAGMLLDRLDERRLLSLSLFLAAICLAVVGLAPIFSIFLLGCSLFGIATGLYGTTRGITLSKFFQANQGRAFGVTLAAGSLGSASLPVIGSQVTGLYSWRVAVVLAVPVFFATAVAMWRIIPGGADTTRKTDEAEDSPTSAEENKARSQDTGGESDGIDVREVARTLTRGFSKPAIVYGVFGYTLMLFTYQALTGFLPMYLMEEKGLTAGVASTLFALLFLGGAVSQLAGGTAADRFGTKRVIAIVASVGIVTLALLPHVFGVVPLAILIVVMSSRITAPSVMNPYIIEALPDEAEGTAWGLLRTTFFSIGATGSTVVGYLSDVGLFDQAFYLLAGLTAIATLAFLRLPPRHRV